MSVGMLTITHHQLGQQLVDVASRIFARDPENLACYGVIEDCDLDAALAELRELRASLDCKDGLLILSDLYGATPYNLAKRLMSEYPETTLVSGINLPMVVKLFKPAAAQPKSTCRKPGHQRPHRHHHRSGRVRMIEKNATVVNKLGLHARAAAKLVSEASQYQSANGNRKGRQAGQRQEHHEHHDAGGHPRHPGAAVHQRPGRGRGHAGPRRPV